MQRSTGYESYARKTWPQAEIVVYDTPESADLDATAGRVDARFDDFILLQKGLLAGDSKDDFARVGNTWPETAFGSKGEGIGVRKGEKELLDAIYKTINDKYFDFDIYGG